MEGLIGALESTALSEYLRVSRWGYAGVNAAHIFGIALLIGATVPLNLRCLGAWSSVPLPTLSRVLAPVAATGLALTVAAGLLLFSVRALEYAGIGLLQLKMILVIVGALSALLLHRAYGWSLAGAGRRRLTVHALVSLACWTGALVCGRFIAFVDA